METSSEKTGALQPEIVRQPAILLAKETLGPRPPSAIWSFQKKVLCKQLPTLCAQAHGRETSRVLALTVTTPISDKHNPQETQHFLANEQRLSALVTQNGPESMQALLARLVDGGATASHLADLAVSIWHRVDTVLSSVFGRHGMSALFRRSLYLARAHYPWLEEVSPGATAANDFDALRAVLAQRAPSVALAANALLLKTFCDLLAKLIGESLSQNLLQPVWLHPIIGPAVQDAPQ